MTWVYRQSTGWLTRGGKMWTIGYSGAGLYKNVAAAQGRPNEGPIPRGKWFITDKFDSKDHGPACLRLEPSNPGMTLGRSGFLIHGDSISNPGTASKGCIIVARPVRDEMWKSPDHELLVIE